MQIDGETAPFLRWSKVTSKSMRVMFINFRFSDKIDYGDFRMTSHPQCLWQKNETDNPKPISIFRMSDLGNYNLMLQLINGKSERDETKHSLNQHHSFRSVFNEGHPLSRGLRRISQNGLGLLSSSISTFESGQLSMWFTPWKHSVIFEPWMTTPQEVHAVSIEWSARSFMLGNTPQFPSLPFSIRFRLTACRRGSELITHFGAFN